MKKLTSVAHFGFVLELSEPALVARFSCLLLGSSGFMGCRSAH